MNVVDLVAILLSNNNQRETEWEDYELNQVVKLKKRTLPPSASSLLSRSFASKGRAWDRTSSITAFYRSQLILWLMRWKPSGFRRGSAFLGGNQDCPVLKLKVSVTVIGLHPEEMDPVTP
jgi:hypothetical protein